MRYIHIVLFILVGFSLAYAQGGNSSSGENFASGHIDPVAPVLMALFVILIAAKIGGALFERIHQPAVMGEIVFGVLLGNLVLFNSSLDFFGPLRGQEITISWAATIDDLARIGVILLLFEVGLESSVAEMKKVGLSSFLVAVVGVVAPFFLGYFASWLFIKEVPSVILQKSPNFDISNIHLFTGAALCATSVGITARVFKDLGKLNIKEAKIILGAAVIDDVLGLIILAVAAGLVVAAMTGVPLELFEVVRITGTAVTFLVGAIMVGVLVVPRLLTLLARVQTKGIMLISSLLFCFILSYLANAAGLATIVGAFAAGLVLEEVHFTEFKEEKSLRETLTPVTTIFVPIFFVVMGIQVHLESFVRLEVIGLALGLTVAAFIGKQVCGLAVVERGLDRLSVGIGMVPRGEVGLIFASIGKSLGVIDDSIFSAIVLMVILTTLITPPLLKFSLARYEKRHTHIEKR